MSEQANRDNPDDTQAELQPRLMGNDQIEEGTQEGIPQDTEMPSPRGATDLTPDQDNSDAIGEVDGADPEANQNLEDSEYATPSPLTHPSDVDPPISIRQESVIGIPEVDSSSDLSHSTGSKYTEDSTNGQELIGISEELSDTGTEPEPDPDYLYFISGRDNLVLILGQGYIGPIYSHKLYVTDFLQTNPGWIPLFPSTLGSDLVNYVNQGETTSQEDCFPFAFKIPIGKLGKSSAAQCLNLEGTTEKWEMGNTRHMCIALPGAIPLSSVESVIFRSEKDKTEYFRMRSNEPNADFDLLKVEINDDLFTGKNSNLTQVIEWLGHLPTANHDEFSGLDVMLDGLSGGLFEALDILDRDPVGIEALHLFKDWLDTCFSQLVPNSKSLSTLFSKLQELNCSDNKLSIQITQTQTNIDHWLFVNLCYILASGDGSDHLDPDAIYKSLANLMSVSDLSDDEKDGLESIIAKCKKFTQFSRRRPTFEGFDSDDILPTSRAFLLAMIAKARSGFEIIISKRAATSTDLLISAFLVGLHSGRKRTDVESRNRTADSIFTDWIASQLSLNPPNNPPIKEPQLYVVSIIEKDSRDQTITKELTLREQPIFQRSYLPDASWLVDLFNHTQVVEQVWNDAALHVANQLEWTDDVIETTVTYSLSDLIELVHKNNQSDSNRIVLRGSPQITLRVNQTDFRARLSELATPLPSGLYLECSGLLNGDPISYPKS